MRFSRDGLSALLVAGLTITVAAPVYANGTVRHHARTFHSYLHPKRLAPAYYAYPVGYAYYVPTQVFRCYPARARVRDQVGFTAGYVPLGTCG